VSGRRRLAWLALTPEPERELPRALAVLRGGGAPRAEESERRRIERLVLHGTRRGWLRYLARVADVVGAAATDPAADPAAALTAAEVVLEHHRMLIGLPGPGYEDAAGVRHEVERAVAALRARVDSERPVDSGQRMDLERKG
jgi:hypothetical protein